MDRQPPSDTEFPQWPGDARPCVWMTAGLLAFRLCDRGFDCENCPLDAALGGCGGEQPRRASPDSAKAPAGFPTGRRYGPAHVWIRRMGRKRVRCGLDAFAARLLGRVTGVILPLPGGRLRRSAVACWISVDDMVFPVRAPVDGVVERANRELEQQPSCIVADPYEAGWLFEARSEADLRRAPGLVVAREQARRTALQTDELEREIDLHVAAQSVGPTLADGGEQVRDLCGLLGPVRYRRLLRRYLSPDGGD